jgi:nitrogen regulatory protein PII
MDGVPGITVSETVGWGRERAANVADAVEIDSCAFVKKLKVETVVDDELVEQVVEAIARAAHTGNIGDGKIFILEVADVLKIRTGERGAKAI